MYFLLATLALADTGDTADTAAPEVDPCAEIAVVPDACVAGETVSVEVIDCGNGDWRDEEVTFELSTDDGGGTFGEGSVDDDGVYRADFVCPEVACPGATANVYTVVYDELGNSNWAFTQVAVSCAPADGDTGAEDLDGAWATARCGCAALPTGGGFFGMVGLLAAVGVRRRGR